MASLKEPRKFRTKLTFWDVLLIIGLTLLIIGVIAGVLNYLFYSGGRPDLIVSNQVDGSFPLEAQPPGNPAFKSAAIFYAVVAGTGLFLSASALIAKLVFKNSRQKLNT